MQAKKWLEAKNMSENFTYDGKKEIYFFYM